MKILVNKQKCPQNHVCPSIKVCSKGAISQETPFSLPVVDAEKMHHLREVHAVLPNGRV